MRPVQGFQAFARDMRVNLGRRHVRMTEQQLHDAKIGAMVDQVGGERMPQRMRRQARGFDSGRQRVTLDQRPEHLPAHRPPLRRRKQHIAGAPAKQAQSAITDKPLKPCAGRFTHRYEALPAPLADYAHDTHVQAEHDEPHADQLGHPQAGRIEQLEHRPVTLPSRRIGRWRSEQGFHLGLRQDLGQTLRWRRQFDPSGRVRTQSTLAHQPAIQTPQTGDQPALAGWAGTSGELGEIGGDVTLGRAQQGPTSTLQPDREQAQVAAIRGERAWRQTVLQPQRVAQTVDDRGVIRRERRQSTSDLVSGGLHRSTLTRLRGTIASA